jgi:SRR1
MSLLLQVLDVLELVIGAGRADTSQTVNVPCFAQDPVFTKTDVATLEKLGITCVDSPEGETKITSKTLVFSPYVDVTILMPQILKGKAPGMYIGVGFDAFIEGIGDSPWQFAKRYVRYPIQSLF